ncbi:ECF-type sigma factor [Marinicella sp. W31]|uniref:ECF-type sigma factor n=1 Tax=Marinicella sp. W31 TaxID=3023713 RepID=UPI00375650C6
MVNEKKPQDQITRIINGINDPDMTGPTDPQVLAVYNELRKVAKFHLRGQNFIQTLTPTVLVNEAYIKLYFNKSKHWKNRKHFYSTASKAIKHILIDAVRQKQSIKRSAMDEADIDLEQIQDTNVNKQLNEALSDLEQHDPFLYSVVELKFFIGLTSTEAGEILQCSRITIERAWKKAKAYLSNH